ncbi:class I SAM-dependent methyltransferase [Acidovorax sp. SRB_24]|uniref:class I SAM-dependent methyltransferase n=1 Tax=Acidovorax sp. SRB_24 TaxID=1962700 RepID=UPI00145D99FE|nr:methyltransferase domain-containing protein [Acidovorax sp. SRB_24]
MKLRAIIKRMRNAWRRHGWRMFGPLLLHNLRYYTKHWMRHGSLGMPRSSVDHIPGVETQRAVYLSELGYTGTVGESAEPYQPIDEAQFRSVMEALPIRLADYAFVDLGSGKGRALLLAAQAGFQTITGVEFSGELHQAAQKNLAAARDRWPNVDRIKLLCGDAAQYRPPLVPVVCYLYNPFGASVMRQVIDVWVRAMSTHSQDVWVVYSNPTQSELFMSEPIFEHQFTKAGSAVFRRRA